MVYGCGTGYLFYRVWMGVLIEWYMIIFIIYLKRKILEIFVKKVLYFLDFD